MKVYYIKLACWCLLVICFFLPFGKACDQVFYPQKVFFKTTSQTSTERTLPRILFAFGEAPPDWRAGLTNIFGVAFPFLFPLFFAAFAKGLAPLDSGRRTRVYRGLALVFGMIAILTSIAWFQEFEIAGKLKQKFELTMALSFLSLIVEILLDFPKLLKKNPLPFLVYQVTFFAALWIFWWFFTVDKKLIGAWLALFASATAFGFATVDYVKATIPLKPAPKS